MRCDVPFILEVCRILEISPKDQGIVFKMCKRYDVEHIISVVEETKKIDWWQRNPIAAFLKSLAKVNRGEFTPVSEIIKRGTI